MIGSVISSGTTLTFEADGYVINPGKTSSFPWLSSFACNFDKYRILDLAVTLVPNQPTSTAGKMGIGIDYDSTDPLPVDRMEFFNLTQHAEGPVWDAISFKPRIDKVEKFVNSHTITDSKLIDCGQIIVMSDQVVATSANLADIIVEYTVELLEPQQAVLASMIYHGTNASFGTWTITGPSLAEMIVTSSTTVVELKISTGKYLITTEQYDAAPAHITCTITCNNCVGYGQLYSTGTVSDVTNAMISVTNPNSKIKLTYSATLANAELSNVIITRVSPAIYNAFVATTHGSALGTY
jgi:hypothetical protein